MVDTHTHSKFSHDGKFTAREMAERGRELGLSYMAITDHCDYDYRYIEEYRELPMIDLSSYTAGISALQEEFPFLALGLECGYSKKAQGDYQKLPLECFDYVLNSVHTVDGVECYFPVYFEGRGKEVSYRRYLETVLESLDAPYDFQGVAHIGYVRKNAPYADSSLSYSDYSDLVDEILKKIIAMDKALEVNTNIKTKNYMPERDILMRYYTLGGRRVTFASDAHVTGRVCELFDEATAMIGEIGFTHWTVYRKRQPVNVPFI